MYDYVDGKVDWMAYGLPVEGKDGPFIGDLVVDVPTCGIDATVGDALRLLDGSEPDAAVVVMAGDGLAVGEVDADTLDGHAEDEALLGVMNPVPSTYRPSVTVSAIGEEGGGRQLVSTPDGRFLGAVTVDAPDHDHKGHDHDHEGHDHDHPDVDEDEFDRELANVMGAIEEQFGDREPSEAELRSFLHGRLMAEGKSAEEADRFLDQLEAGEDA